MLRSITWVLLCFGWLSAAGNAATVPALAKTVTSGRPKPSPSGLGNEALAAILAERGSEIGLASASVSPLIVAAQIALVVFLVSGVDRMLSSGRPPFGRMRYALAATPAISRIRATIARKPFERCADK